jgi:hypothetical protein
MAAPPLSGRAGAGGTAAAATRMSWHERKSWIPAAAGMEARTPVAGLRHHVLFRASMMGQVRPPGHIAGGRDATYVA